MTPEFPFIVTPPAGNVIEIDAEFRRLFSISDTTFDSVLAQLAADVVAKLDGINGDLRDCVLLQRWALPVDSSSSVVRLPFRRCRNFTVEKLTGEAWAVVAGATVTKRRYTVEVEGLPDDRDGVAVLCDAGADTADDVSGDLKHAIRMTVGAWWRSPEGQTIGMQAREIPGGALAIFDQHRNMAPA